MLPDLRPPVSSLERIPEEWEALVTSWGEQPYRGRQVFRWIHHSGVIDPEAMTDLSKRLRGRLAEESLAWPLEVVDVHRTADRTRKLLVRAADGREVETVLIPQLRDADPDAEDGAEERVDGRVPGLRITQCISSQVGCAMGCVFCASGRAGLKRNLSAAEIVGQVLLGRAHLEEGELLRNVVFMGMGEPLHNYDAVARALVLLTHPQGLDLSSRRVTVSTSGLVPEIDRLAADFGGQVQLAISLHAASDEKRSSLMPINRKHPVAELVAALRRYPLPKRRRITIEYTLMRGVNDAPDHADGLARLFEGIPIKVNLIPMNPIDDIPLSAPASAAVLAFQERLRDRGVAAYVRTRRGDAISAACGQLALAGERRSVRVPVPTTGE